ncbi:MAG TPA: hypothetical protein PKA77_08855 [Chitinophagaceae bacterium]|jgi:hypothetical protein|nr:hypothetical protein [Chitinophagaceae bacterium]HMU57617.1 hypothetical protein [Chitinophagaceae bacterium]
MKKLSLILTFASVILSSCASYKVVPFKGTYLEPPFKFTSTKTYQQVWDNLIDLFAQKGLSIKLIDKSSGLLISNEIVIKHTVETKTGSLVNSDAYIVVPLLYNKGSMISKPINDNADITGEWNVRVKESQDGTIINVNLVNLKYFTYDAYRKIPISTPLVYFKSTGKFEEMISSILIK